MSGTRHIICRAQCAASLSCHLYSRSCCKSVSDLHESRGSWLPRFYFAALSITGRPDPVWKPSSWPSQPFRAGLQLPNRAVLPLSLLADKLRTPSRLGGLIKIQLWKCCPPGGGATMGIKKIPRPSTSMRASVTEAPARDTRGLPGERV
jgi:hypothetical protein